jgi:hypothetical protein
MPPMWRNMYKRYDEKTLNLWTSYYFDRREPRSYEYDKMKDEKFRKSLKYKIKHRRLQIYLEDLPEPDKW